MHVDRHGHVVPLVLHDVRHGRARRDPEELGLADLPATHQFGDLDVLGLGDLPVVGPAQAADLLQATQRGDVLLDLLEPLGQVFLRLLFFVILPLVFASLAAGVLQLGRPDKLGPLAGKIWRFGIMGYSCRPDNVMLCLSALGSVLDDMGYPVHVGEAEAAARRFCHELAIGAADLLDQAQVAASLGLVSRVQHLAHGLAHDLLAHGLDVPAGWLGDDGGIGAVAPL